MLVYYLRVGQGIALSHKEQRIVRSAPGKTLMTFPIVGYYIVSLQLVLILTCTADLPKDEGGELEVEGKSSCRIL